MHDLTAEELNSVAVHLRDAGEPPAGPLTATLFTGGRSNLTYRVDDGVSSWVLRTPPRRGRTESAHNVRREYTVMRALVDTDVPVPYPVALCEDEPVLGVPFLVTRLVPGHCLQTRVDLGGVDAARLSAITTALVDALATLHAVDHTKIGLADFGRPTGYAQRQIRRWTRQWSQVGFSALHPLAEELSRSLRDYGFTQDRAAVVHGDYRIDNTLIDLHGSSASPRIQAIIDWELSTIGEPTADVATMCVYRHRALDLILGFSSAWTSPRIPDADSLAGVYERASGRSLRHWDAHVALAYFKLAVIAAGIDHRHRVGGGHDTGFDKAAEAVPVLLQEGLDRITAARR